jgi:cytidylate kinase
MIITIDGPVASGKSSVAQQLAQRLGFYYLNTGLLYRAVAYVVAQQQPAKAAGNGCQLEPADLTFVNNLVYTYHDGKAAIGLNGQDLTPRLYQAELDRQASIISAQPAVREALLALQRSIAQTHDVVADGRDCGTVVFPLAAVKFYLTADAQTRAKRLMQGDRRYAGMDLVQVMAAVQERDQRDQTRPIAPLKVPQAAVVVDSSSMTIDAVVELMATRISLAH